MQVHSETDPDAGAARRPMSVVVVAPHPDDAELGMGGTIARLVDEGHRVLVVDLTDGEPTPRGTPERRRAEAAEADRILGCSRVNLGLRNRELEHTIEARHRLAAMLRETRCEILFVPHPDDVHPDHLAATRIASDARFDAKLTRSAIPGDPIHPRRLIHYYCTHLRAVPSPTFVLDISAQRERKRDAILAYRSQVVEHEPNRVLPERVDVRDRHMGSLIGVEAAEPFWCRELPGLRSLDALIWTFASPERRRPRSLAEVPATTPASVAPTSWISIDKPLRCKLTDALRLVNGLARRFPGILLATAQRPPHERLHCREPAVAPRALLPRGHHVLGPPPDPAHAPEIAKVAPIPRRPAIGARHRRPLHAFDSILARLAHIVPRRGALPRSGLHASEPTNAPPE